MSAWITFDHWFHEDEAPGIRHEERLGFAKTNNRWGLSLCRVEIDTDENDEESTSDAWLFNDAPRNMRLKAIEHLPDLVEALAREAEQTAKKVVAGANLATNLVRSVNSGTKERGQ